MGFKGCLQTQPVINSSCVFKTMPGMSVRSDTRAYVNPTDHLHTEKKEEENVEVNAVFLVSQNWKSDEI